MTLEVKGLSGGKVIDVSFSARRGEILGIGGLVGAGRTETARLIFGADRRSGGETVLHGRRVDVRSPLDAVRLGIALIPEDRKQHGVLLGQTIRFNIIHAALRRFAAWGFLNSRQEKQAASQAAERLAIKAPSVEMKVGNLSGGNQQKVVLAKWMETEADILIFDEPTRGIDVGAKQEIYRLMRTLSAAGKTIIMISSEMPELLGMSDRLLVLRNGRTMRELTPSEYSQALVLSLASGISVTQTQIEGASCD